MFDLTGKVALVTGGSRGLGRAFAQALAGAGARVAITARSAIELEQAASEINGGAGSVIAIANLGEYYRLGQGVPRDLARARALYQEAIAKGFAQAQEGIDKLDALEAAVDN